MAKEENQNWKTDEQREERKQRLNSLKDSDGGKKKIKKSISPLTWVGLLLVLAVIGAVIYFSLMQSGINETSKTAAMVNGEKVSPAEANFFLGNLFQQRTYNSAFTPEGKDMLASVFPGPDMKPLRDELIETFEKEIQDIYGVSKIAKEKGLELRAEDKEKIDNYIASIDAAAAQTQRTPDEMYKELFGPGVNQTLVRSVLERAFLTEAYRLKMYDETEVTEDDIQAAYEAEKELYDVVSYRSFVISDVLMRDLELDRKAKAEKDENKDEEDKDKNDEKDKEEKESEAEKEEKTEESEKQEETEASEAPAMPGSPEQLDPIYTEKAANAAEKMKAKVKSEEDFVKAAVELVVSEDDKKLLEEDDITLVKKGRFTSMEPTLKEWLFDEARKAGDVEVIRQSATSYQVVYFINRELDETPEYTTRHILVKLDPTTEDREKARLIAQDKAEKILQKYEEGEKTEEAFAELAKEYSEDPGSKEKGGLYEAVQPGNFVPDYEEWATDPARKKGDVGMIFVESRSYQGYHIIYYISSGKLGWKNSAEFKFKTDRYMEFLEAERKNFTFEADPEGMKYVLPADEEKLESARQSLEDIKTSISEREENAASEETESKELESEEVTEESSVEESVEESKETDEGKESKKDDGN